MASDPLIDLTNAFRHPRGLEAARYIVRRVCESTNKAPLQPYMTTSPSASSNPTLRPTFDAVLSEAVLSELLTFNDALPPLDSKRFPLPKDYSVMNNIIGVGDRTGTHDTLETSHLKYPPNILNSTSNFLNAGPTTIPFSFSGIIPPLRSTVPTTLLPTSTYNRASTQAQLNNKSYLAHIDHNFLGFNSTRNPHTSPPTRSQESSLHSLMRLQSSVPKPANPPVHNSFVHNQSADNSPVTSQPIASRYSLIASKPPIVGEPLQVKEMTGQRIPGKKRKTKGAGNEGEPAAKKHKTERSEKTAAVVASKKRTAAADGVDEEDSADGEPDAKRVKRDKAKAKRAPKPKAEKKQLAKHQLDLAIWMRILEFAPPAFLGKARLINSSFKGLVDQFTSIYVNCRKENFGSDMPPPPQGLTERQYTNLLNGGKGCMSCDDTKATRAHWSWAKRWCTICWKKKIERHDRAMISREGQYGRILLNRILQCIPVGVHDSFTKPHDYTTDTLVGVNTRLYKYHLAEDIDRIIAEYEALTPAPYVENPEHDTAQKAAALASHQLLLAGLDAKQSEFLEERTAANKEHMKTVQQIEAGIRRRMEANRAMHDEIRDCRRAFFSKRAREDIPHISAEFVKISKHYKAAVRIFRDRGSERGWRELRGKIEAEWNLSPTKNEVSEATSTEASHSSTPSILNQPTPFYGVANMGAAEAFQHRIDGE